MFPATRIYFLEIQKTTHKKGKKEKATREKKADFSGSSRQDQPAIFFTTITAIQRMHMFIY